MAFTLMVVEDETELREMLCGYLRRKGYDVIATGSGDDFERCFASARFDLILLDLNLPDQDGLALLQQARASSRAPVFVVSGRPGKAAREQALDLGADDFVAKPFSLKELDLRIRNFLRRQQERDGHRHIPVTRWWIGRWVVDIERRTVTDHQGGAAGLTRAEFDLLVCLVRANGGVVTRARIISTLGSAASAESLPTLIYRLRRKLGIGVDVLVTVPGIGLRIEQAVMEAEGGGEQ